MASNTADRKYVDKDIVAKYAARLKLARVMSNLSQRKASMLSHVPQTTISDAENGKCELKASSIVALANLYHVDASWLLLVRDITTTPYLPDGQRMILKPEEAHSALKELPELDESKHGGHKKDH